MKLILPIESAAEIEPHLASDTKVVLVDSDGNLDNDASDAEVYLSWFLLKSTTLHQVLAAAPALRWHHAPNAGVNHILTPTYLERDLTLTNGAGVHAIPVAEFVLAYILNHAKYLPELHALQAEHHWKRGLAIQELTDATLLIIGAGAIGQEIAVRAKAFGMRVFGSRRHPQELPNFDKVVGADEWRSLLPFADYIVVATPLTPETQGLIDEAALRSLPNHAYLINIARGAVVDEPALVRALTEGWIAGAALDTVIGEPLASESPLWSVPNVLITPHCSGHSPKVKQRSVALFLDNLTRYQTGQPLRNIVDKQAGY
ncbi:phosphoglycerate dehydrogenase-like oxidoreductase [Cylindrospermum stagnale PCC 7417]|uniref:Phosphoglycerate dehydrogenase-like oxidoreductase n=1 Tax=Cylindrospermum stagnale PCC 7417 TaxID=56107 RepID=K9WU80_9NOST|nr:D-2-hydroxyacid dehydrogenase [Cylindrospermum stagnale]AFZ23369.1 phosphoglycerate dehydrogenase-like oxidoreductase [Cylindrospermum stagnale PCC 7417]